MKVPIKLPENAEILIQAGQTVDFSTPLLRKKATNSTTVPLADLLKFPPEKIFMSLKKVVGDEVKKGDLIAEHKGIFSTKQYFSSIDGIIREIDHLTGSLTMELQSNKDSIVACFFQGEVDTVGDGFIELKVNNAKKMDTEEYKHYMGGPVFYIEDVEKLLTEDDVLEKILVGENINALDHAKIETLGAKGFISKTKAPLNGIHQIILINSEDLSQLMKEQYPFCITGVDNRSIYFYS